MNDETFAIDFGKYRVVDLSYEVVPGKDRSGGRPFLTEISPTLPDGKDKEVVFTHTHVGTHIETARHFFGPEAKPLSDFPLEGFMGRAVVLPIQLPDGELKIEASHLERAAGDRVRTGDILILRNERLRGDEETSVFELHTEGEFPYLAPPTAERLVSWRPKMIVFGAILMGRDIESGLALESALHENEIPILEYPGDLHQITKPVVFFMALPFRAKGLGSCWARAICIERR